MARRHVEEDDDLDRDISETEEGGVVTDDDDDEDLVWDRNEDDGDVDDDEDVEDDPEAHNSEDREFTGDDADDAPAKPKAEPEPSVREQLSAAALHGLRGKGRDKPLSAQSNQWVLSTIGRLVEAGSEPGSPAANDLRLLMDAVEKRGIPESLSNATHAEVARIIRGETPAPTAPAESRPPRPVVVAGEEIVHIPLADIDPDPEQARDEGADDELADSIAVNGVLQPIRVYRRGGRWMIEDGERRYRGAVKAGDATIPAREVPAPADVGDKLLRQVTLNEGKRLKPMEEARSWKRIMESKHWSAAQLATAIGKPKSTVSDRLAILDAPAAFQPLFIDGTLSAAAAPIVRQFADAPEKIAGTIVEHLQGQHQWRESVRRGKTVPIEIVKGAVESVLQYQFAEVPAKTDFDGEMFEVKGKRYAVDSQAFYRHEDKKRRATQSASTPAKDTGWQKQQADENRRRQLATERKLKLRSAQAMSVAAKLPGELTGAWALLLIDWMLSVAGDGASVAQIAGIELPKNKTTFGPAFDKLLHAHAEKLDTKGRTRFMLQIALSEALDTWGPDALLKAAAKLLKIDLAKIKPPADEQDEKPAAAKPAKSAKKRR